MRSILHTVVFCKYIFKNEVEPVSSSHAQGDKTGVPKTGHSPMQVESVAECILQFFRQAPSDHQPREPTVPSSSEWQPKTGLTVQ